MKKTKVKTNSKGITLIALVVTIVVLLILAGVSINLVLGNNGIITKAKDAREEHRAGTIKDHKEMWEGEKELAKYGGDPAKTKEEFLNGLISQGLLTQEEKATIDSTGSITIGSQTISFSKTLVDMFDAGELKIGDYVNYKNPTSGEYTAMGTKTGMQSLTGDSGNPKTRSSGPTFSDEDINQVYKIANNQLTWRILGKDKETGGLKLIAGSPMQKESAKGDPYLMMYGAQAYLTGPEELDNICAMYKNNLAVKARSVNIDDVNAITGITTPEKIREVDIANSGNNPAGEAHKYGGTYEFANHWTPEAWLADSTTPLEKITGPINGYGYLINAPAEMGEPSAQISDTRIYDLLFKDVEYGNGKAYWLASRGVIAASDYAAFGPCAVIAADGMTGAGAGGMFYSDGYGRRDGVAVRPVVILRSDVTVDDIQKIEDQPDTWKAPNIK